MKELVIEPESDEIMTVEETARHLKTTTQTIYTLIKKGKLNKIEISTVDKPGARPIIRIKKSDVDDYLKGN
ncbi:MAG: helix-turn-helix domain-containing protein [bacterium]